MKAAIEAALAASGHTTTAADVAAYFGAALAHGDEASTDVSSSMSLRARLLRPGDDTTTTTLVRPAAPIDGTPTALDIPIEVVTDPTKP
jgi:hypothetical protein